MMRLKVFALASTAEAVVTSNHGDDCSHVIQICGDDETSNDAYLNHLREQFPDCDENELKMMSVTEEPPKKTDGDVIESKHTLRESVSQNLAIVGIFTLFGLLPAAHAYFEQ